MVALRVVDGASERVTERFPPSERPAMPDPPRRGPLKERGASGCWMPWVLTTTRSSKEGLLMPFLLTSIIVFPILILGALVMIDRRTARSKSWNEA